MTNYSTIKKIEHLVHSLNKDEFEILTDRIYSSSKKNNIQNEVDSHLSDNEINFISSLFKTEEDTI